nr:hypothetical protein [uncultured Dysosmobacter sp.]
MKLRDSSKKLESLSFLLQKVLNLAFLLLSFSSESPLENKGLHGGMRNADDENSAGDIDLGGRCEEIPIGKRGPTHRDSNYE